MPRPVRVIRTLVPSLLIACSAFAARPGSGEPVSIDPALRDIHPGEPRSERFLSRDRSGGVMVDVVLEGDLSPDAVRARGIEVDTHAGRLMTARCPLPLLDRLLSLPGLERVGVAGRCTPHLDRSAADVGLNTIRVVQPPTFVGQAGAGVLIGTVDTGVDFTHSDFLNQDGTTRIVSIWDQTAAGSPPAGFGYGTEWTAAQINAHIPSETDFVGHGTHVLGIAAGNGSATDLGQPEYTYVGVAPLADLCVVKTNFQTTAIVDGVSYIFQKAASLGKRAVVNLSLGTQDGPHDGTLDLDRMLNALVGPGKIVVASAGNEGTSNLHGQLTLSGSTAQNMTMNVPSYTPASGTGNDEIKISGWYSSGSQIKVTIVTPGGTVLGPVATGANLLGQNTNDGYVDIRNATTIPFNGAHEIDIDIFDAFSSRPPRSGIWTFTFTPVSILGGGRMDTYIYDSALDAGNGAPATWIQGLVPWGVVASPGDADSVLCVGAYATKDCWDSENGFNYCWSPQPTLGAIASFSSAGPRRDGSPKPDLTAPGLGITSSLSIDDLDASPTYVATDGVHINMAGTSMSAPHVTGGAALLLARKEWAAAGPTAIRTRLLTTCRSDNFTGVVPNKTWGFGKLDLGAALAIGGSVPRPAKGFFYAVGRYDSTSVALTGFGADSVVFSYSTDGGATYPFDIGTLYGVPAATARTLTFFVDAPMATSQGKIRAVAHQGAITMSCASDSLFSAAVPSAVESEDTPVPARFALAPNSPNPFNPITTIRFELDRAGPAALRIYSVSGSLVRTLVERSLPVGRYHTEWDGRDAAGRPAASGVYVYRLDQGGRHLARKMSLLK